MTQDRRENYRNWAERFVIGAAAAARLHTELQRKEFASMRESFLRCEMDKELAAALQPKWQVYTGMPPKLLFRQDIL